MSDRHGSFVWYELMSGDPEAAAAFYGAVIGWSVRDFGPGVPGYSIFEAAGVGVAGLMKPPEPAAALAPAWYGYVGVDDVDASAAAMAAAGGSLLMPASDVEGVGRMAMLHDPQGAPLYVMRGVSAEESASFRPEAVGHCAWNELVTSDQAAALALYPRLFGWEPGEAMPMPGMEGGYRFLHHGGEMIGAVMNRMDESQPPRWNSYFRVDDIDRAARTIGERGGRIDFGPAEVPGGDFAVCAADPQGAAFGIVGRRR